MIDRYDPFGRTMSLRQMMDRILEDAFVMPRGGQSAGGDGGQLTTALNVYEEGDDLIVEAQLPGLRPEDVEVTVERGTLTIRGETKADEERKERNYLIREHRRGTFSRSVTLPETVDPDAAKATFEHGMLRLTFPKSQQARPRRIQVAVGGSQPSTSAGGSSSLQGSSQPSMQSGDAQGMGERSGAGNGATRQPAGSSSAGTTSS